MGSSSAPLSLTGGRQRRTSDRSELGAVSREVTRCGQPSTMWSQPRRRNSVRLGDFDLRAFGDDDPIYREARPVHALEPARMRLEQCREEVAIVRRIEVHKPEPQGAFVDVDTNEVVKVAPRKNGNTTSASRPWVRRRLATSMRARAPSSRGVSRREHREPEPRVEDALREEEHVDVVRVVGGPGASCRTRSHARDSAGACRRRRPSARENQRASQPISA